MIEAHELRAKLGDKGFHDFVVNGQRGKTMAQMERGIKGRVRYRKCEHGTWIIDDYERKPCSDCVPVAYTKGPDFEPHFNVGLGAYVESKSEMMKLAKRKGMVHIGTDRK